MKGMDFSGKSWWPLDSHFVRLMKATTRTQKTILKQGRQYVLSKRMLAKLNQQLSRTKTQLIIISSAKGNDQIIPSTYKQSLQIALREELPGVHLLFTEIKNAGHMLQVEQTKKLVEQLF